MCLLAVDFGSINNDFKNKIQLNKYIGTYVTFVPNDPTTVLVCV